MCGIAGVVGQNLDAIRAHEFLDALRPGIANRGPDGVGRLIAPGAALLHTRLAIIDLETGDQPIWNERRTVACVYNGEIYNYRALSADLAARGHTFATHSDTEVLVHLYEDHGADLVRYLQGMYAFAIYDAERRQVLLARDRLGIKPLYLTRLGNRVAFASSIASLLAAGASADPDPAGLVQYLRYYRVPEPRTAYRDVEALLPGHVAIIDAETGAMDIRPGRRLPAPSRERRGASHRARRPLRASGVRASHRVPPRGRRRGRRLPFRGSRLQPGGGAGAEAGRKAAANVHGPVRRPSRVRRIHFRRGSRPQPRDATRDRRGVARAHRAPPHRSPCGAAAVRDRVLLAPAAALRSAPRGTSRSC